MPRQPKDKVQEMYDQMAADYEGKIVPAARYAIPAWLERDLPAGLREGAPHVLDLGCGSGNLVPLLRALNPRVRLTGMDLSPAMVEEARKKGAYEELFVHDLDLPLPLPAGARYHGALILGALEFVEDPVRLLKDCAARMPRGAWLLATFQASTSGDFDRVVHPSGILQHAYSEAKVRAMLDDAGFTPRSVAGAEAYFSPSTGKGCPYHLTISER